MRCLLLAQDLLKGLADLHAVDIIMCDLKPDNVLLDEQDHPLLCDFGISKDFRRRVGPLTSVAGTPSYMCAERCRRRMQQCQIRVMPYLVHRHIV